MPATATPPEKYVVLHTGVGKHARGAVLPASEFNGGDSVPGLVALGAIRPAAPEEAVAERVEVRDERNHHLSYESLTLQKDREIAELRLANNALLARNDELKQALARPQAAAAQAEAVALFEKDREIRELQLQIRDLKAQLHEAQGKGKK